MLDTSHWKKGDVVGFVPIVKPAPIAVAGAPLLHHIVITESGRERRAREEIEDHLGLEVYWPRLHRKIPAGRRRSREIEISMFPGRIFVAMPSTVEAWHHVRVCRGVHDFMMLEGPARGHVAYASREVQPGDDAIGSAARLATLPDFVIAQVRKMEAAKDAKYLAELARAAQSPYTRGRQAWVEFMLQTMLVTIEGRDDKGRIDVLTDIEIFGRRAWKFKPHQLKLIQQ